MLQFEYWKSIFGDWTYLDSSIEKQVAEGIRNDSVILGLDGSVKGGKGAFSFGIFDTNATPIVLHHGPVHGDEEQQNSTRSEMHGILGGVLFVRYICEKYSLESHCPTICVFGDNTESLRIAKMGPSHSLKQVFSSDMDIAYELFHYVSSSTVEFDFQHVKAHQDDENDFQSLSVEAKINVQCDKYVGEYFTNPLLSCAAYLEKIPHYVHQKISLSNPYTRITSSFRSNTHRYKIGHEAELQCSKTWNISSNNLPHVDWYNLCRVFRGYKGWSQNPFTKAIHRQWPTMVRENDWNRSSTPLCPLCNLFPETVDHVFQCTNVLIKANRSREILKLKTSLTSFKTSPLIINHVNRILLQYCDGYTVTSLPVSSFTSSSAHLVAVAQALQTQISTLGIQNFLFGVVTPQLRKSQAIYYKNNPQGRKFNADIWGRWIVRAMLEFSTTLWKYRCEIVHEKSEGSMERRLRSLAIDWLNQLRQNPTLLPVKSRYLLNRSSRHFKQGDLRSVNAWIRRMDMELQNAKITPITTDIWRWFPVQNKQQQPLFENNCDHMSDTSDSSMGSCSGITGSMNAICDLILDSDTIPTLPNYNTSKQLRSACQVPDSITFFMTKYTNDVDQDNSDRYEYLHFKKKKYKIIIEDDSVGTDTIDSLEEHSIESSITDYVFPSE